MHSHLINGHCIYKVCIYQIHKQQLLIPQQQRKDQQTFPPYPHVSNQHVQQNHCKQFRDCFQPVHNGSGQKATMLPSSPENTKWMSSSKQESLVNHYLKKPMPKLSNNGHGLPGTSKELDMSSKKSCEKNNEVPKKLNGQSLTMKNLFESPEWAGHMKQDGNETCKQASQPAEGEDTNSTVQCKLAPCSAKEGESKPTLPTVGQHILSSTSSISSGNDKLRDDNPANGYTSREKSRPTLQTVKPLCRETGEQSSLKKQTTSKMPSKPRGRPRKHALPKGHSSKQRVYQDDVIEMNAVVVTAEDDGDFD